MAYFWFSDMPLKHKTVNNFRKNRDIIMNFFVLIITIMVWNDDEMVGVAASLSQPPPPNQG
jgi:hypothetical protein